MLPDLLAAADFVVAGLDDGDAVGVEVAHNHLAAIGLEREADRRAAYVNQRQHVIVFVGWSLQLDGRYLRRSRAGNEGLGRVGQDRDVFGLLADRQRRAHAQQFGVNQRYGVVTAVRDHDS